MKKILITGAGGFIGGFIVEEAIRRGFDTWAGVRKSTNREFLTDDSIRFVDLSFHDKEKLITQLNTLKPEIGKWDYIVHNLGVTKCRRPDDFDRINSEYVRNFAEALTEVEMVPEQFIFMSSLGAWGAGDEKDYSPICLSDTPHPNTRYGSSKLKAENYLRSLPDFPYVFLRPTGVYGPRERDYLMMMKTIQSGIDFSVGYRPQIITFIYVKDLVKVIFSAIEKGVRQKEYFISDGKQYSSTDFRRYVAQALNKTVVIPIRLPLFMVKAVSIVAEYGASVLGKVSTLNRDKYQIMKQRNWICDISPLQEDLGFSPDYDLERGVTESIAWYKREGWL